MDNRCQRWFNSNSGWKCVAVLVPLLICFKLMYIDSSLTSGNDQSNSSFNRVNANGTARNFTKTSESVEVFPVYDKLIGLIDEALITDKKIFDLHMKIMIQHHLVPVVFVCYGEAPKFLLYTIEMAARFNPVMMITDNITQLSISSNQNHSQPVFYVPMSYANDGPLIEFNSTYKQIYLTLNSKRRRQYEYQCFTRWLIVESIVSHFSIPHIFYADNDVTVLANMTTALAVRKQAQQCDVMLSVQGEQPINENHYLGHLSGHSSFWSLAGLRDFCTFMLDLYRNYIDTLRLKGFLTKFPKPGKQRVVDMTILYLYYVGHHRNSTGWDTGRPESFRTGDERMNATEVEELWEKYDFKFNQTRDKVAMPNVSDPSLKVCNGLDVIDRACFDHMWSFYALSFNLNINSTTSELLDHFDEHHNSSNSSVLGSGQVRDPLQPLLPFIVGSTSYFGGRSDSRKASNSSLYFPTLHYQGNGKNYIPPDVCRRLVSRTQYYAEEFKRPHANRSEIALVLSENNTVFQAFMLNRIVSRFVRRDCTMVLQLPAERYDRVHG